MNSFRSLAEVDMMVISDSQNKYSGSFFTSESDVIYYFEHDQKNSTIIKKDLSTNYTSILFTYNHSEIHLTDFIVLSNEEIIYSFFSEDINNYSGLKLYNSSTNSSNWIFKDIKIWDMYPLNDQKRLFIHYTQNIAAGFIHLNNGTLEPITNCCSNSWSAINVEGNIIVQSLPGDWMDYENLWIISLANGSETPITGFYIPDALPEFGYASEDFPVFIPGTDDILFWADIHDDELNMTDGFYIYRNETKKAEFLLPWDKEPYYVTISPRGDSFAIECEGSIYIINCTLRDLPDLLVEDVDIPVKMRSDEKVDIMYQIINRGTTDVAVTSLIIMIDGRIEHEYQLENLGEGGSFENNFTWTALEGHHSLELVIDPNDTIAESNETNNVWSYEFYVEPHEEVTQINVAWNILPLIMVFIALLAYGAVLVQRYNRGYR